MSVSTSSKAIVQKKLGNFQVGLFVIVLIVSALNISLIFNESVWCDEAFTLLLTQRSFADVFDIALKDAWPPFYTMSVWAYSKLVGNSVPMMKLFSLAPTVILMLVGATYVYREFKSSYIAAVFIVMLGVMPVAIHMNIEIRGYSWAMLFVTASGLCAWRVFSSGLTLKRAMLLVVVSTLAAYTHYYALVSVAFVYLFLFIGLVLRDRKHILSCIAIAVCSVLFYLPWMYSFITAARSVSKGYWIEAPGIKEMAEFFFFPFTAEVDNLGDVDVTQFSIIFVSVGLLLFLAILVFLFKKNEKEEGGSDKSYGLFCIVSCLVWVGTIAVGCIVSCAVTPMFIPRYMTPCLGLVWLFFAVGSNIIAEKTNQWSIKVFVALLIALTGLHGYLVQYHAEYGNGTEEARAVVDEYLNKNSEYEVPILSDSDYLNWSEIRYYFPEALSYEDCSDISKVTNEGTADRVLYMATSGFKEQDALFRQLGYTVTRLGSFDFDNCYYFDLYSAEKP